MGKLLSSFFFNFVIVSVQSLKFSCNDDTKLNFLLEMIDFKMRANDCEALSNRRSH